MLWFLNLLNLWRVCTYFCTQWADVSTQPGLINTPPHQCPIFPNPGILSRTETCQGQEPSLVSFPWIILPLLNERFDFFQPLDDWVWTWFDESNKFENKLNSFDLLLGDRWFGTISLIPHFSSVPWIFETENQICMKNSYYLRIINWFSLFR